MIIVYKFYQAPQQLKDLSTHGGDEDWLAIVNKDEEIPLWMDEGTNFGCCSVTTQRVSFRIPGVCEVGDQIVIGAHA